MRDWFDSIYDDMCSKEEKFLNWAEYNIVCDECGNSFLEGYKHGDYLICEACKSKYEDFVPCDECGDSMHCTSYFPKIQIAVCDRCIKRVDVEYMYERAS